MSVLVVSCVCGKGEGGKVLISEEGEEINVYYLVLIRV